jgi:hypothetical protein
MPVEPQPPFNPCSLKVEGEQIPAKIWELLRRNDRFRRAVRRLTDLDTQVAHLSKAEPRCAHPAWRAAFQMIKALSRAGRHPFAACALEWLVPEPIFRIRQVAPRPSKEGGRRLVTVLRGEGTTPDPRDKRSWRWFSDMARPRLRGGWIRRGPELRRRTKEDPRVTDKGEAFKEWEDYGSDHGPFTGEDSWRDAPPEFRRRFLRLWRQLESRSADPAIEDRAGSPELHEENFFVGWRLQDLLSAAAETGSLSVEAVARSLRFDELARDYRLFAVPKAVRTRSEARRLARWIFDQLLIRENGSALPDREREIFGTELQWRIFLTVAALQQDGAPLEEALMESFDKIHLREADWHEGQPVPDQRRRWGQYGPVWKDSYRKMDSPLTGSGLVQLIFPRFEVALSAQ